MSIQTSFSTLACPDWSWDDILAKGYEYGFDGVEVRLIQRDTELLKRGEFAASELPKRVEELQKHNFQVCGLASSVRFDYAEPEVRGEQVRIGKGYVDLAKQLGARFVRVFGDVLTGDQTAREQTMGSIAAGLRALGEYGQEKSVAIIIETHGDFSDSRLMQELMERVNHPNVGVLWDTHHPWKFFGEPLAETWKRLGRWVRHTHWKDSGRRARGSKSAEQVTADEAARKLMSGHRPADYVLFGEGEFPAAECMGVLKAAGYDGWFSYEWEKAWHPEIEEPEVALPPFPERMRSLWDEV